MNWTRRDFMATSALAAGAATLAGCAGSKKEVAMVSAPDSIKKSYFESRFGVTPEMANKVMAKALERGGKWGELFFEHARDVSLMLKDSIVSQASTNVELGMGVRAVVDDQVGFAYTESLMLDDMLRAAEAASMIANGADAGVVKPAQWLDIQKKWYDQAVNWDVVDIAEAAALLRAVEVKARAKSAEITKVQVGLSWKQRNIQVITSDGTNVEDSQPYANLRVSLVMERGGEIQSNSDSIAIMGAFSTYNDERIDAMLTKLTEDTAILFEAVKPKGGDLPVVLGAGASGILLHEAIGHGLEADFNRKAVSIFADKLNKQIANNAVTIVDSGENEGSRGALNVDDEGTPSQKTVLVQNGVLQSYMHDKISAAHYGVAPTGSGRRESYKWHPIPRMRTTYMEAGDASFEDLIKDVKYGVYCTRYTNGQVLIGAGDYTFYVKNGFLIEDGKLTAPIKDVNIIGNGPDTLSKITRVGNDFAYSHSGWTCGKDGQSMPVSLGMPSVLVSSISVGGI